MSSRVEEKQRRRAEREAREREALRSERRTRRLRTLAAGALALLAVLAIARIASEATGGGSVPASSRSTFGQHYEGLAQRRQTAGVSTMAHPNSGAHIHPMLAVWANGRRIPVAANIGIDPTKPSGDMAGLHTHDSSGTIHDEGMGPATLAQFFAVWGVPFGKDRLGPYRASAGKGVQMWVDGRASDAWGRLQLKDGQQIIVAFGSPRQGPPS